MTGRILAEWIGDDAFAFRLSNGKVIKVPADDLDTLAHEAWRAWIERRNRLAAEQARHDKPKTEVAP